MLRLSSIRQSTLPPTNLPAMETVQETTSGFGAFQWDLAVHRNFSLHESLGLQFRTEMFNVLNHPNSGPPANQFGVSGFGLSNQILAQSLKNNNLGGGAFGPLYQIGGPRSIQPALKLQF